MPFALRNLLRRPIRSTLTLLGIALGVTTYLVLVSASAGVVEETESIVRSLRIDLIVQRTGMPIPWQSRIRPDEVAAIRRAPGVAELTPVVVGVTRLETRPRFFVFGAAPDALGALGLTLVNGRVFVPGKSEILAGADAARELDLKPGDRVAIIGRRELTVVGIYRTGRQLLDGGVLLDRPDAQEAFRLGDLVNLALVGVAPGAITEDVVAAVTAAAPELEAIPADLFARQQDWLKSFARFARTLALLALAIAALGISNTLSMNVAERTGEIGLLRAIGWRRARIARLVIAEGLLLSACGAALGLPAAAAILRFLTRAGFLGVIPARLPAASAAEGIAAVLAAGLLASLPPLIHALRILPARALREL
ncbi:MAG: ABC transporter permease [Acidobacteria bacterium]|nr:ABC transporter permease [Acidobacteriota bacterium]